MKTQPLTEHDIDRAVAEFAEELTPQDHRHPCTCTNHNPCPVSAAWYLECTGCGRPEYVCEGCRIEFDEWIADNLDGEFAAVCLDCHRVVPTPTPWMRIR